MDYKKTYSQLIDKRRNNPLSETEYGEIHHIVPKSEGGNDDQSNLVKLTAREHYVAHLLLARIYNDRKMWGALLMMSSCKNKGKTKERKYKISSRLYQLTKVEFSKRQSKALKGKPPPNKGVPLSKEQKEKLRKANLGRKQSEETKAKIRLANLGKKYSAQTLEKLRLAAKGRKRTKETCQKLKTIKVGTRWYTNGIQSKQLRECPEGWWAGKSKKKKEAK